LGDRVLCVVFFENLHPRHRPCHYHKEIAMKKIIAATQMTAEMSDQQKRDILKKRLALSMKQHGGFRSVPSFIWRLDEDKQIACVTSEAQAELHKDDRVGVDLPYSAFGGVELKQGQRWAISMKTATLATSLQKMVAVEPTAERIKTVEVTLDEAAFLALTEGK